MIHNGMGLVIQVTS